MPIAWSNYKGKKILVIDLKGLSKEEMLITVEEQKKIIDKAAEPVLILNDFNNTIASKEYVNKAKKYGAEQKHKIKKTALLGIQGIKKYLTQVYIRATGNKNTKIFDNMEEAKEYLVTD